MTAEQSPQVKGSVTSFAHAGQYITTAGSFPPDAGFGAISMSTDCNTIRRGNLARAILPPREPLIKGGAGALAREKSVDLRSASVQKEI